MNALFTVTRLFVPAAIAVLGAGKARDRTRRRTPDRSSVPDDARANLQTVTRNELRVIVEEGQGLDGIDLERADLSDGHLDGVDFSHLSLFKARLGGATMTRCRMVATDLSYAQLRGVDLRNADLRAANVLEADLGRANLCGADLSSTRHHSSAVLRKARFDRTTKFPHGFDAEAAGAIRQRLPRTPTT
jgi:hypothetical protein